MAKISVDKRRRLVTQQFVASVPFSESTARIKLKADLERQYSTFRFAYYPAFFLQRIAAGTADELLREYGLELYERMAEDPMIAGVLNDILMGVVTQRPEVLPVDESEEAQAMARFMEYQLDYAQQMGGLSLVALLRQMLRTALVWGHSVAEMVFDVDEDGYFVLRKLVPILPTRYQFALSSEGEVVGIVPLAFQTAGVFSPLATEGSTVTDPATVPLIKLIYVVHNRRGSDPTGDSFLLPAFKPWVAKKELEEYMLLLAKRYRKSWLGVLPPDAQDVCVTDPETGEQRYIRPREELLSVLVSLANGEGGIVPAGTQVQAFDVEVNAAGNYYIELHKLLNREILRALYSRMLANNGDAAASTTGEFDREMVAKTVRALRAWYEDSLLQWSYKICALNFGERVALRYAPRIIVGRGDGIPYSMRDVAVLHQSGWFTRAQKAMIDRWLGLPNDDGGELIGVNSDGESGVEIVR